MLGLVVDGVSPVLGVVYAPALDELFFSLAGAGAYKLSPVFGDAATAAAAAAAALAVEESAPTPAAAPHRFMFSAFPEPPPLSSARRLAVCALQARGGRSGDDIAFARAAVSRGRADVVVDLAFARARVGVALPAGGGPGGRRFACGSMGLKLARIAEGTAGARGRRAAGLPCIIPASGTIDCFLRFVQTCTRT
jgi:fructose-1,6-bisphosphatase/inositol monophosphatase family enzyme